MRSVTTQTIAGRVNADGSIATGAGFVVQKVGTGSYIVTFPGARLISAVTASGAAGGFWIQASQFSGRGFVVSGYTAAQAAADGNYSFVATVTA